jgi:hypothetical protein
VYFLSNRSLWKPVSSVFLPTVSTAIAVTSFMMLFTYVPQAAILTLFNGPFAVVSTIALVLSESSTITNLVSRNYFMSEALVDTFDATLVTQSMTPLVSEGRTLKAGSDAVVRLGKLVKPFQRVNMASIIRYFMYLPLNLVPVVGTAVFIYLQAKRTGPQYHARYFQLKQMSGRDKEKWVERKGAAYTSFGLPAQLLQMIPFVGIFTDFTTTVGAALWASDLERDHAVERTLAEPPK